MIIPTRIKWFAKRLLPEIVLSALRRLVRLGNLEYCAGSADEIVDPRVVYFLKTHEGYPNITNLSFRQCYFGLYWQAKPCILPVATSIGFLRRNHFDANVIRRGFFESTDYRQIGNDRKWGGWQASWCLRIGDLQIKLQSALRGDGIRWGD
jgi:hypothetical protein